MPLILYYRKHYLSGLYALTIVRQCAQILPRAVSIFSGVNGQVRIQTPTAS